MAWHLRNRNHVDGAAVKWNCGHTWRVKERALRRWHPWYAWYPVRVGVRDCRWLETVERKVIYSYDFMDVTAYRQYRAPK